MEKVKIALGWIIGGLYVVSFVYFCIVEPIKMLTGIGCIIASIIITLGICKILRIEIK